MSTLKAIYCKRRRYNSRTVELIYRYGTKYNLDTEHLALEKKKCIQAYFMVLIAEMRLTSKFEKFLKLIRSGKILVSIDKKKGTFEFTVNNKKIEQYSEEYQMMSIAYMMFDKDFEISEIFFNYYLQVMRKMEVWCIEHGVILW